MIPSWGSRVNAPGATAVLALVLALCAASAMAGEVLRGRVTRVSDGDTVTLRMGSRAEKIRLVDIDAPELAQPHGRDAKDALEDLVLREPVTVSTAGRDRHRRILGRIERDRDGLDVNLEMVRMGHAWAYSRGSGRRAVEGLEAQARLARRGLWTDAAPERPSDWRRRNPREH